MSTPIALPTDYEFNLDDDENEPLTSIVPSDPLPLKPSSFSPASLWTIPSAHGPLLHVISFLDLRTATTLVSLCRGYRASLNAFLSDPSLAATFRPNGLSKDERLSLTRISGGATRRFLELILIHHRGLFIKPEFYGEILVDDLDLLDSSQDTVRLLLKHRQTLLEYAASIGSVRGVHFLLVDEDQGDGWKGIRREVNRRRSAKMALWLAAAGGHSEVVGLLLQLAIPRGGSGSSGIDTVGVNRALLQAIHREQFETARRIVGDHRVCFNYRSSSHLKALFAGSKLKGVLRRKHELRDSGQLKMFFVEELQRRMHRNRGGSRQIDDSSRKSLNTALLRRSSVSIDPEPSSEDAGSSCPSDESSSPVQEGSSAEDLELNELNPFGGDIVGGDEDDEDDDDNPEDDSRVRRGLLRRPGRGRRRELLRKRKCVRILIRIVVLLLLIPTVGGITVGGTVLLALYGLGIFGS